MFERNKQSEMLQTIISPRVSRALNLLHIKAEPKLICDFFEKIRLIERKGPLQPHSELETQSKKLGFKSLKYIPHPIGTPLIWASNYNFGTRVGDECAYIPAELGIAVVSSKPYAYMSSSGLPTGFTAIDVNYVPVIQMISSENGYNTYYKDVHEYQKPTVRNEPVFLSSTYLAPLPRAK